MGNGNSTAGDDSLSPSNLDTKSNTDIRPGFMSGVFPPPAKQYKKYNKEICKLVN